MMPQLSILGIPDGDDVKSLLDNLLNESHPTTFHKDYSVACIVCRRKGVESNSEAYLADYVKAHTKTGNSDFYAIMKAAGQLETVLQLGDTVSFGPRKQ